MDQLCDMSIIGNNINIFNVHAAHHCQLQQAAEAPIISSFTPFGSKCICEDSIHIYKKTLYQIFYEKRYNNIRIDELWDMNVHD